MSKIEELIYSAHEHGKREVLLKEVSRIKDQYPFRSLKDIYDEAYEQVMRT